MPSRRAAQVVTIHDLDFLEHPERTSGEIRRDYGRLARARGTPIGSWRSQFTAGEIVRQLGVSRDRITIASPAPRRGTARDAEPPNGYVFFSARSSHGNLGVLLDAYSTLIAGRVAAETRDRRPRPDPKNGSLRASAAPFATMLNYAGMWRPKIAAR